LGEGSWETKSYSRCKVESAGAGAGASAAAGAAAGTGAAESFISTSSGMAASAARSRRRRSLCGATVDGSEESEGRRRGDIVRSRDRSNRAVYFIRFLEKKKVGCFMLIHQIC
jgi:hypothetical protein